MTAWPLLLLCIAAPPIAGRPGDFSGAVGGPFRVSWVAPPEADAETEFDVVLRIEGPGEFDSLRWPGVTWPRSWIVESWSTQTIGDLSGVARTYRVRAESPGRYTLPRVKLVTYHPGLRSWQTTYAEPHEIVITGRAAATVISPAIRRWWQRHHDQESANPVMALLEAGRMPDALHTLRLLAIERPASRFAAEGIELLRGEVVYPAEPELARHLRPEAIWLGPRWFEPTTWLAMIFVGGSIGLVARSWRAGRRAWLVAAGALVMMPLVMQAVAEYRRDRETRTPLVVAVTEVGLREGNGEAYPVRMTLPRGTEARLLFARGDWRQVELASGLIGWARRSELNPTE